MTEDVKLKTFETLLKKLKRRLWGNEVISGELKDWLEWARQKADWYDQFTEAKDELLDEINKDTLELPGRNPYYGW